MEEHIIKHTKSGNILVKAGEGYNADVGVLCKLKDTDNGLIAKFPGYGSVTQDYYVCLDYAQAEYLYLALKEYYYEAPSEGVIPISGQSVTIDWDMIDSQYNYVAMDHDGTWYAYEDIPVGFINGCWDYRYTEYSKVYDGTCVHENIDWKRSLFKRPSE